MPQSDQGLESSQRYQFVPRVLIFLTLEGSILLIKGAPDKRVWPNLYSGLGGHVERGESIIEGAQREVLEESGLAVDDLWLCASVTIDAGDQETGITMFVFRGVAPSNETVASSEGSLEWVNPEQLHNINLVGDLPELLARVLNMSRGDPIVWGHYDYDGDGKLQMDFH